jgi:uncharacterized protein YutE (UPF0331/DUF86 family)
MINRDLIERKCSLMTKDLDRLKPYREKSFDQVASNAADMAVIERLLERIITRAIDINSHLIAELGKGSEQPYTYEATFQELAQLGVYDAAFAKQIAPSAGLRNRLVHDYNDTDPQIIFASVGHALEHYAQYCAAILKFAEKKSPN